MKRRGGPGLRRAAAAGAAVWSALIFSAPEALAQGCAMCRTAVEGVDDPLTRGISMSVLFMLSMPFAIFSAVAGWFIIANRRGVDLGIAGEDSSTPPAAAARLQSGRPAPAGGPGMMEGSHP